MYLVIGCVVRMVQSVPISNEDSKRFTLRIIILSGISITSGAILIPLTIVWYIQPPPIGYLASILALILLIVMQLGVQRLRYYLEVCLGHSNTMPKCAAPAPTGFTNGCGQYV